MHMMYVPAIRTDRQRGGRSSYDGCSPHGRPKAPGGTPRSSTSAKPLAPRVVPAPYVVGEKAQHMPRTPQLLDDLTAIESLMSEEDSSQQCCVGKLAAGDTDIFGSLLHFADHCLYKIVRWARNLPDFSGVSVSFTINC